MTACAKPKKDKVEPDSLERLGELKTLYASNLEQAQGLRDPATGWLAVTDCDGMIWAGKYAASNDVADVNIEAAEYPDAPGKFGRRPPPYCWNATDGDVGSKTEWSRDMFVAGLLPYVWRKDRRDILERHLAYGKANNWQMGEPIADGRTIYTPSLIGLAYSVLYAMGGELDPASLWPSFYPSGLSDYEAHLQVMAIWSQGEAAAKLGDSDAVPKDPATDDPTVDKAPPESALRVGQTMYERLEEHADREPACPLYQTVYALYSGKMARAIDSLLAANYACQYYRGNLEANLADWLFAASIAIDHAEAF
jgi:hypothetical protein